MNILNSLKCIFTTYPFLQEGLLICISVILGGIITVAINKGARRKQSEFEMQYAIIDKLFSNCNNLVDKLNSFEILLSFKKLDYEKYEDSINDIEKMLFHLNSQMREQRKFIRKFLKAKTVEFSAHLISDFHKIFHYFGDGGIADIRLKEEVSSEMIGQLRNCVDDTRTLHKEITETLERFISPGIISKIKRKVRGFYMLIEEMLAIVSINRKQKKRNKKRNQSP